MKKTLDEESRCLLIKYRLQRADETLEEAAILIDSSHYNAAVNRLYYACYYAAIALLLRKNISVSTHAGVKTMLGLHYISTELLSKENGRIFNILFDKRHSSDYEDLFFCDKETVGDLLPKAKDFIVAVKKLCI